jgi:aarF domain-containing kinase
VRPNPANPKVPQLVLLDHGLYAIERPEFKYEYALFWKSLFLNDQKTLVDITRSWGIHDVDLFASATLMRPFSSTKTPLHLGQKVTKTDVYEMQMAAKARAQKFFQDTHLLPRELILVGRNMNIIRAINKELGSPVNRIARMVQWAVRGLGAHAWQQSTRTPTTPWQLRKWFSIRFESLRFRLALWALSAAFYWIKVTEWLKQTWLPSTRARGFEQILDDHMSRVVEQEMGIPVDVTAFNA